MGKYRCFTLGLDMTERRLVARVSRVERINDDPLGRTSYELDASTSGRLPALQSAYR